MIGKKKVLLPSLMNALQENIPTYKSKIFAFAHKEGLSEEAAEKESLKIRDDLLEDITQSLHAKLIRDNPDYRVKLRWSMVPAYPSVCGFGNDIFDQYSFGVIYAIFHYCLFNKTAKPGECIALNHVFHDKLHQALVEVYAQMKSVKNSQSEKALIQKI